MSPSILKEKSQPGGISGERRIAYASAFLELGLVNAASDELEAICGWARVSNEVLAVRVRLYTAARQWDMVEALARALTQSAKDREHPWLALAQALFMQGLLADARDVLHEGETYHAGSGPYQFELARYNGLLGNVAKARHHLARALWIDRSLAHRYPRDPDFASLRVLRNRFRQD